MKRLLVLFLFTVTLAHGQGYNHQWLLGNNPFVGFPNGRAYFDLNSSSFVSEFRKMSFKGTEANISDASGNLLMSSNGVWVANASGDTMMNGSGLNPGGITPNWPNGLPMTGNNIFLPFPADPNKYILMHHTGTFNGSYYPALEIFSSLIDITQDGGLGALVSKNNPVLLDTMSWGIGACKHANGRDWWVVAIKDNSDLIFKILIDSTGISSITSQSLGIAPTIGASVQLTFSQNGTKFICTQTDGGTITEHFVRLLDFDRCTGSFSNPQVIDLSSGGIGWGLAFSPSGKFAYACSSNNIFQIDTDNLNVVTVATYDGFISPVGASCCATSFFNMYLAANGKIYVTSGSSVQHIHEINYPDSSGVACDVQQHAINLVDYLHLRAVPNHPNYYLGCDTASSCVCLTTSLEELENHDFKFSISPNPSNGNIEIKDVTGRTVYTGAFNCKEKNKIVSVSNLAIGIYTVTVIINNNFVKSSKLSVVR